MCCDSRDERSRKEGAIRTRGPGARFELASRDPQPPSITRLAHPGRRTAEESRRIEDFGPTTSMCPAHAHQGGRKPRKPGSASPPKHASTQSMNNHLFTRGGLTASM